ncbi:sigma-70 family RNA polymerase sigma factor [Porifericola rhodea]|uniref:RNA polymerase sigma factor n=1 Tax=Porifericola rhodea TaxID=930972 RepID=UPI002666DA96|nr:sigma-70 family RNA polymerase sigma factor [Porifericola rhodea]WKN32449.1 sigma-70 family RNA polymerase sigma factor [Porifericola rhodea]
MIQEKTLDTSEDYLWAAFREGSENAFDLIYGKMFSVLYDYGYRLCQDEEVVKDCIQNIFIEIWQKREQVPQVYSLKHYFLKIMRRKVFKVYECNREHTVQAFYLESSLHRGGASNFPVLGVEAELEEVSPLTVRRLKEAITQLSTRKKEAILLKFFENLSYGEISEVMGLRDPKYARQLIYRSLDELRKHLKSSYGLSFSDCALYTALLLVFLT